MLNHAIASLQPTISHPTVLLALFATASLIMIWRLHAMEGKGFEGTVLGTLIMPYCSGFANLVFAYVMSSTAGNGRLVIENCIVNNATNLTLILGLASLFGSTSVVGGRKSRQHTEFLRINRLNLLFTLIALFLFTGTLWALAKDGVLDFYDGLVLIGLFMFWQILHVFEILKDNIRKRQGFHWSIVFDLVIITACAYGIYYTVDHLVAWVSSPQNHLFSSNKLGWLSGVLMVMPNAFIALYYARAGRQDIVLSSQIGDGHICIPMCIGLFSVFNPIQVPEFLTLGCYIILGAAALNFLSISLIGRVPRFVGAGLLGAYGFFLYQGL